MNETQSDSDESEAKNDETRFEANPRAGGVDLSNFEADSEVGRRVFITGVGVAAATAAGAGTVSAQSSMEYNRDSEYAHTPTAVGKVTVATHKPEYNLFGYIADDDSDAELETASLAEREDSDTPHNPVRIRADKVFFSDRRAFPQDLTTTNDDGDEVDASALDAEFWTTDESGTAGTISVADASDDRLQISTSSQGAGDAAIASFTDFTISDGEQRRVLQLVANIDQLGADTVVDVEVVDSGSNSVVATIDSSADSASDSTIATATGQGVIYQQQLGDLPDGDLLDTIEEVKVTVSEGDADFTLHGLNLESSSKWDFGTREYVDSDDEVSTKTVYDQTGYFGITSIDTLYETDRLSDAEVHDVEYPDAEIDPTSVSLELKDGDRYEYAHRLQAVHNFDLPSAYDLTINLSSWVDEVAHPSGRYLAMETATGLDDTVAVEDTDDVEWTTRTSSYSDASIGDEVSLPSTVDSSSVFALSEDVLLREEEADEVVVEGGAAMGPTGQSGGGFWDRIFSIPGAIAGSIMGLGVVRWLGSRGA